MQMEQIYAENDIHPGNDEINRISSVCVCGVNPSVHMSSLWMCVKRYPTKGRYQTALGVIWWKCLTPSFPFQSICIRTLASVMMALKIQMILSRVSGIIH